MHTAIETSLAYIQLFHRFGFNIADEVTFAVDSALHVVGLCLRAQGKPDYLLSAGTMEGTDEEIEEQWEEAMAAWQLDVSHPGGISEVQRRIWQEMYTPVKVAISILGQLIVRGYEMPGVPPAVIEELKTALVAKAKS